MTEAGVQFLLQFALNVVYAALILIAALWLSGFVRERVDRLSGRHPKIDPTLFGFLASLARYGVLAVAVIFVLGRFGIETTSLVALLGVAGLAVGLALQGTLANFAAGVMLILFRPIKRGDFVEIGGRMGTVREIALFFTELTTTDNVQVILPNGDVWSRPIVNYSAHDTRRCDLTFGVSYSSDLKRAETAIREVIEADPRVLPDPEPAVRVAALSDSSVDFSVRVWCDSGDWWPLKCDLTRAVKEAFDSAGIEIPFPSRTIIQT